MKLKNGSMEDEYKTIKVKRETYDRIRELGLGISRAVDILVKTRGKLIQDKFREIEGKGVELANILFKHGFFNIRFEDMAVEDVEVEGELLKIKGYIALRVSDAEVRERIWRVLKREAT